MPHSKRMRRAGVERGSRAASRQVRPARSGEPDRSTERRCVPTAGAGATAVTRKAGGVGAGAIFLYADTQIHVAAYRSSAVPIAAVVASPTHQEIASLNRA